jgi:cytochrome c peroxidase
MPVPEGNPVTEEKVALGRRLFHDRRLSRDRSIACASCHDPDRAFTDARPLAIGVQRRLGRRSAPALIRFVNGNRGALSSGQRAGLQLFRGKGNCTACHVGPTFTDERFHNTGVAWRVATPESSVPGGFRDDGRFVVTGRTRGSRRVQDTHAARRGAHGALHARRQPGHARRGRSSTTMAVAPTPRSIRSCGYCG